MSVLQPHHSCVSLSLHFRNILTSITHRKEASRLVRWWQEKATPWSGRLKSYNLSLASKSLGSWTRTRWMWSRGLAVEFLMWPTTASSQVNPNGKKIFWHTGNEIESFPIQRERHTSPSSYLSKPSCFWSVYKVESKIAIRKGRNSPAVCLKTIISG